jgi:membrane protein DedA with SNARE-associated domain
VGGHAGYWIGTHGGTTFVERHGKWILLTPPRLERTQKFFAQHGVKTVLTGRFVAFVRSFVGIFAGISQMPMRVFTLYNAAGGTVWVLTFSTLGYVFGRNLPRLIHYIGRVSLLLAILIALIAGVVFLWRWFEKNRTTVVASLDQRFEARSITPRSAEGSTQRPGISFPAAMRAGIWRCIC